MTKTDFIEQINSYTKNGIPYLFLIDFELKKPFVCKLSDLEKESVFYTINNKGNFEKDRCRTNNISVKVVNPPKYHFKKSFDSVLKHIKKGNSYLLNLTFSNRIWIKDNIGKNSLLDILKKSNASYKLYFKDEFISFSPEQFIKIQDQKIYTFPMKGTIDAKIENAEHIILSDEKETNEHNTIVDLMRNDLAMVSSNIKINRFRFIDKIKTSKGQILQVSSEIEGSLPENWQATFGELLYKLLPAGSISGAPKPKTLEIIKTVENKERGYYTGVFGIFDGENVDSAVLIRFIENIDGDLFYRSGGGITAQSNLDFEFNEMLQKIYIPI
jgi:para-aminobenzoate synthetase component 1